MSEVTRDTIATLEDIKAQCNELFRCIKCDKSASLHYHDYIEVIHSLSKNLSVTVNDEDYTLQADDFLIILPNEKHEITCSMNGAYLSLAFDKHFLFSSALSSSDLHYILPNNGFRQFFASNNYTFEGYDNSMHGLDGRTIFGLAGKTVEECEKKQHFYRLAVRGNLTNIALYIFRQWELVNDNTHSSLNDHRGITKLINVLNEVDVHYADEITAESMADLAGMSYSYFSRYFKNVMGITFSEYLNQRRIEEAEKLLKDTDIPIFDVAKMVGFTNTSYFIAQFKKRRMMTPKKFKSTYSNVE